MTQTQMTLVKEGTTDIEVILQKTSLKGPGVKEQEPFYNPSMVLNRDLSILVNQWLLNTTNTHLYLLDGLAASGVRGIRYSCELTGDFDVTINDWNDQSFALIQHNIKKKNIQNIYPVQKDLNVLLSERRFHSIDIDPFGSPISFLDSAMRSIYHNGVIACTATDTAALCGVFPKVCYRRYGAWPLHAACMHEIGLRILLGVLCREAAKYEKGIEPLLCYATDHYLRVYVQVKNGKNHANNSMEFYSSLPAQEIPLALVTNNFTVGPLWMGNLHQKAIVQELRSLLFTKEITTKNKLWKLLSLLEEEADAPPFFYTMNDLGSLLKRSAPSMNHLFEHLEKKGYLVTRTHITPTGFKTNAPLDVITEVFK